MFPASYDRYIEVFGGGGWVLFGKPPDDRCMEIYNDYNSNLANLFYCVKNRTGAFLKELGFLPLNSRDEFTVIRNFIEKQEPDTRFLIEELELAEKHLMPPDYEEVKKILLENAEVTDVKRAAAFFKLIRYSYGSGCTSFGCRPFDVRNCFDTIWQASRRLADTVIENKDFEALIRQYDRDSAFFYCDPPYYETEGHYAVVFRKEDHKRLRDTLTGSRGKWMVSYNDCDFIRELYAGYFITAVTRINNLAQRYEGGCEFPEVIITNYDPGERERSKPRQLMEYAGWQEGRSVDISIAEKYYADHGVPMMKTTQRFYRKYFGLCYEWYLAQKKLKWAADFEFALFPYLVNGIKNHLEDAYFRDMSGCELAEIEQAAGQKCQPIGHIGYYYPAEVWISEYGKLYAKYEYQDEIECFPDVFALIERELRQCKFDSAAMKTVEALDEKL